MKANARIFLYCVARTAFYMTLGYILAEWMKLKGWLK